MSIARTLTPALSRRTGRGGGGRLSLLGRGGLLGLGGEVEFDVGFAELFFVEGGGGAAHEVGAGLGFGEGDDVADVGGAAEEHDDAVDAEGEAAVGGGAELEGVEEEAEAALLGLGVDAEEGEDLLLDVHAVDTDGAAADFAAI
jgi:hypothetical protein